MGRKKRGFIEDLVSDGSKISSKRLVTLLSFILIAIGFLANLFWNFTIEEFIYSSIMYIVIAGLGIVGAEKFAKSKKPTNDDEKTTEDL